jgi:hypothetical protein
MIDTLVAYAPNGARPLAYVVRPEWVWVHCDVPGCEGFAIEARANITNAERDWLNEQCDAMSAFQTEYLATPAPEREAKYGDDSPLRREWALAAPLVRDWNAVGLDAETGEERPIPPPAVGGPDVFLCIFPVQSQWIMSTVLMSYRLGKPLKSLLAGRGRSPRTDAVGSDAVPN